MTANITKRETTKHSYVLPGGVHQIIHKVILGNKQKIQLNQIKPLDITTKKKKKKKSKGQRNMLNTTMGMCDTRETYLVFVPGS